MVLRSRMRAGVTAIEYALIAGLVAVVIVGGVSLLGGSVQGLFESSATEIGKIPGK